MGIWWVFLDIVQKPSVWDVLGEVGMLVIPLWIAVVVGVLVGWSWKPKWATFDRKMLDSSVWSDCTKAIVPSSSTPSLNSLKFQLPSCISWIVNDEVREVSLSEPPVLDADCSSTKVQKEKPSILTEDDLEYLCKLVEVKDGGPEWIQMMDCSTPTMSYQAWRRDPETGPPQYRSRTVYEDVTPEMLRDFFWDDEFRSEWDDMLLSAETLEECPINGGMTVQWVRKFPFFCSDREYIIGRRIWESGQSYYCVTKGVPCSSVPRRNKPRRVDLYYSSWCIRAVESRRGDGKLSACEVTLFHYEDMGIRWEIAKFGVRQGMWRAVKKIELGLRAYQKQRAFGAPLSRCAFMAQINTKVSTDYLRSLESDTSKDSSEVETQDSSKQLVGRNIPKLLVVGGAIALACTLDRGLLTKAVIFGVGRRFAKVGRRL